MNKYDAVVARIPSNAEMECWHDCMRLFSEMQAVRNLYAGQWDEIAALILPSNQNTFMYGAYNTEGQKRTQRQVDATGAMALSRFAAICDSLLTPRNMFWHSLAANDEYVMKDRATKLWFEAATKALFKWRYSPRANFVSQNQRNYTSLGAFGTGSMFIDRFDGAPGIRYKGMPLGETFFIENHQGIIDTAIRWFRMTAGQAERKWPGRLPAQLHTALNQNSQTKFDFLHVIRPREMIDQERMDYAGMPFQSVYLSIQGQCAMFKEGEPYEGGYATFPIAPMRYEQAPEEVYGRGPASLALPTLKTLNAQKRVFLKQGHRASDPVLLVADDGLMDLNLRPGALNKGAISADGKKLVDVLPSGDIQINEKMMEMEKALINDTFLVTLFQILTETPQMTATEVIERTNEKGILLAPTVGRQQSEYLGPMIDRELDVLAAQRLLPPMPPRLREAKGEYQVVYTSPLARAMRAQEAAGWMRTLEHAKEVVAITQDPSPLDRFDFDVAIPEIAEINSVPASWMADDQKVAEKRKARAQAQQQQAQIQALPAQAAMVKAQAVAAKAQGGQQQPPGV